MPNPNFKTDKEEDDNLLLNLSGGLLPEYLSKEEVALLENKYGEGWFEELGYNEQDHVKPRFD